MKRYLCLFLLLIGFTAFAQSERLFDHKSGKFTMQMEFGGQTIKTYTVFDDFGAKQWSQTETMGQLVSTLLLDGKSYILTPMFQELPTQETVNYMNLTPEVIQKYKIEMVGIDTVEGYDCLVYTLKVNQQGFEGDGKVWIWDGIPICSVVTIMNMTMVTTISNLEVDIPVDQSLFQLPN